MRESAQGANETLQTTPKRRKYADAEEKLELKSKALQKLEEGETYIQEKITLEPRRKLCLPLLIARAPNPATRDGCRRLPPPSLPPSQT